MATGSYGNGSGVELAWVDGRVASRMRVTVFVRMRVVRRPAMVFFFGAATAMAITMLVLLSIATTIWALFA